MNPPPDFLRKKYDDVAFIGEGGHGQVYKCTHTDVITAVKILNKNVMDSKARIRFSREIDMLQRVDHKHIVKLLDAGETEGYHWYESEFASQGHFGQMAGYIFYSDWYSVVYFRQILSGIQFLHDYAPSIIHRDLKPSNILVFERPEPSMQYILKIADFGSATFARDSNSITTTGQVLGTAHYIAPEPIKTRQSDIYSLGITFLEACTGRSIPSSENIDLAPEPLRPIISQMIRHDPNERYQSAGEIIEELNKLPFDLLYYGRKLQENEFRAPIYQISISREIENILNLILKSNPDNIQGNLKKFERLLDRLGEAYDHIAYAIAHITGNVLKVIDEFHPETLLRLVHRFLTAAEATTDQDFFSPAPYQWSSFLSQVFQSSTYRPTKSLSLKGLTTFLTRFDSAETKKHFHATAQTIDDPSYFQELADCLREADAHALADIFDGVEDKSSIDFHSLERLLSKSKE